MKYQPQGPDLDHPIADIESKYRAVLPGWLAVPLRKASKWGQSRGKVAVVVWIGRGERIEEAVATLSLTDLKALLEAALDSPGFAFERRSAAAGSASNSTRTERRW